QPEGVEKGGLARRSAHPREPRAPGHGVEQARLADVRAADERDLRQRRRERHERVGERPDEFDWKLGERVPHASRLARARSVTIRGEVPSVIASLVMTISRTSSRVGRSYMMSVIMVSRIDRSPRAPV